jgi:DNA polymerase III subunit alpha
MFVHLHNHTDYSLLDSAASIDGYVKKAQELGMSALAITDHGNMYGALSFYFACKKAGIKPILGCEFYIAPKGRTDKDSKDKYSHLILLAMDETGYKNLLKLNSIAWTEGFYYKPRIDKESLEKHNEGLICLSACVSGEVPKAIIADRIDEAYERAKWYKNVFGDRYYFELQNHGLEDEFKVLEVLPKMAKELGVTLVCTNDIHYINKEDSDIHDTLICIGTRSKKSDRDRMRYKEGEFYFRSEEEMAQLFPREILDNSVKVADRCNLEIALPGPVLPKCPIPSEFSSDAEYLRALSNEGLKKKYPAVTDKLKERLEHELGIIEKMDFPAYFLIVQDYINWAKKNGISVGPGRGSGAGSLVAYCIGITDIDPIKYGLLFERFLNPDRVSMPDFDVDFCFERRGEVIEYVKEHYGKDHVGQICTFTTLKAKAVIKDVARVLDFSPAEANELTGMIPDAIGDKKEVMLSDAIEAVPILKDFMNDSVRHQRLFDTALKLEGLARNVSLHAAGIVIGRERLDSYVPLCVPDQQSGMAASQYTMTQIEDCGLVKMDFLGLKTLTLIDQTVELIRKNHPDFDILKVQDNDKKTLDMLTLGHSDCVFQFESKGMQDILKKAKPSCIEDLVALNALYRPGPIQFINTYIENKANPSLIKYPDPALEELLKPTYGVIVYQEQVMKAAQIIAGYSLGQADNLRRIMGKKKKDKLAEELIKFVDGAVKNGNTKEHAEEIFHILEPFAGYGFNKSHAVAYTVIAYRTAYLKAHFPVEFMAANLTNELGDPDKFEQYANLCSRMGIEILPPDINKSDVGFSVEGKSIRFGIAGIKGIGKDVASLIVKERENGSYENFDDFIRRSDQSVLSSRVVDALIIVGAFSENREDLLASSNGILKAERSYRKDDFGQGSLFSLKPEFIHVKGKPKSASEWIFLEKDYLGGFVSGQPLDAYPAELANSCLVDGRIRTLGFILSRRDVTTKRGERMSYLTIRTKKCAQECIVFPSRYECLPRDAKEGEVRLFYGRAKNEDGKVTFLVENVENVASIG